jgi:hypothetical protein
MSAARIGCCFESLLAAIMRRVHARGLATVTIGPPARHEQPFLSGWLQPRCKSEDVLVDTRGFIYVTHKNQGLWILKQSGK